MKPKSKTTRGFTLVELLVVIVIIAALAGLTAPMVIRQRKKADQTEAVNNAKQIGLALFEFENEYGSYPDATTAIAVKDSTGTSMSITGTTNSNDLFRQLLAGKYTESERMFYAKISGAAKPDDDISTGKALADGEVGFGYIMKGDVGYSAAGNPSRPIAVTPLKNNATDGTFDIAPFDSKAIVLRMDNSVTSLNIKQTDFTINLGGVDTGITKTGLTTVWGDQTEAVTIKPPKMK